ncbi:hypothetical protein KDA14_03415, partial [Candidatus Saccharibacteria bacterium]|nr:hypothetical protein [Candidatus Saccharibacteria bacterium]
MSVAERDFSTFHLGDNVLELADGVIPEIADKLHIYMPGEPSINALGALVGAIGKNKVLRDNEEVQGIELDEAVDLVTRSGVQQRLSRSIWTPDIRLEDVDVDASVVTGGVYNWMNRTGDLLVDSSMLLGYPRPVVHVLGGSRKMDSGTEKDTDFVREFLEAQNHDVEKSYPTEADYLEQRIVPRLERDNRFNVHFQGFPTTDGEEIALRFARNYLRDTVGPYGKIAAVRVANAGVQLALQMRKAIRKLYPGFDD